MAVFKKRFSKSTTHRLGKAEARQQFSPLVESLAAGGRAVEITDYGKVAAVMLGYEEYMRLLAHADTPLASQQQLRGSAILIGDLEEAGKDVSTQLTDSIKRTIKEL